MQPSYENQPVGIKIIFWMDLTKTIGRLTDKSSKHHWNDKSVDQLLLYRPVYTSKHSKLTLKIIRLSVHEDVVDHDHTEHAGPQVQVTEQQHKAHVLREAEMVFVS